MPVEVTNMMPNTRADAEFNVLRQTIARRGTARMVLVPVTFIGWAALSLILATWGGLPLATLIPLMVLAAGFEAVHALHVGAERIGRYLQVYYEAEADGPRWETTVMAVGPGLPGGGINPLFSVPFVCGTVLNLLPGLMLEPNGSEIAVIGVAHAALLLRIVRSHRAAARQRAVELESFRAVLLRQRDGQ
jgi:hypothetical protein